MKPYIRVIWNWIRLSTRGRYCSSCTVEGAQLLGWDTKLVFGKGSKISLSGKICSDGRLTMIVGENAELMIGKHVYFNERTMISCQKRIVIGEGCKFGPNVTVIDNDHLFTQGGVRGDLTSSPISIGKNCWIGASAVILKGTIIGDNCVIGAGCIVKGTIPAASIVTQDRKLNIKPIE